MDAMFDPALHSVASVVRVVFDSATSFFSSNSEVFMSGECFLNQFFFPFLGRNLFCDQYAASCT